MKKFIISILMIAFVLNGSQPVVFADDSEKVVEENSRYLVGGTEFKTVTVYFNDGCYVRYNATFEYSFDISNDVITECTGSYYLSTYSSGHTSFSFYATNPYITISGKTVYWSAIVYHTYDGHGFLSQNISGSFTVTR